MIPLFGCQKVALLWPPRPQFSQKSYSPKHSTPKLSTHESQHPPNHSIPELQQPEPLHPKHSTPNHYAPKPPYPKITAFHTLHAQTPTSHTPHNYSEAMREKFAPTPLWCPRQKPRMGEPPLGYPESNTSFCAAGGGGRCGLWGRRTLELTGIWFLLFCNQGELDLFCLWITSFCEPSFEKFYQPLFYR